MLKESFLSDKYLVSDEGFVLSQKGKPLKFSVNPKGYCIVTLCLSGKPVSVALHTLVARAFCFGYEEGMQVNHKDGNKKNNCASNLEWVTAKQNIRHSVDILGNHLGNNNANARKIMCYNQDNIMYFDCIMEAAQFLSPDCTYTKQRNVQNSIWRALNGYRKTYKKYIWKYVDDKFK